MKIEDIIQKEEEWTRMFDSDVRVAMAILTYIRDHKHENKNL